MIPVILAGGSGTRLWPLSRKFYPKQFLALAGKETMLQATLLRLEGLADLKKPVAICNEEHRFLVAEQLLEIDSRPATILLEPFGRNTAPAVALAALHVMARAGDDIMLVLPADHVIRETPAFHEALAIGGAEAVKGALVTFGIQPESAHTGYGYIRQGAAVDENKRAFRVEKFAEKPDAATARRYIEEGGYSWNSGMFMFLASRYLESLERHAPEILQACRRAFELAEIDRDFTRVDREAFAACPDNSIDYAVMEKTDEAVVVPMAAGWSDVGAWSTLQDVSKVEGAENVEIGDVIAHRSTNCYLRAESRLLAAVGLENIIVVETPDAVLVANRDQVQDVKAIVNLLNGKARGETLFHKRVYRPWGWYEGVDQSERFQVKRIMVKAGASLSLQMHHHRAEHWVVVRGTARVTSGDRSYLLTEDQSTYIPIGQTHRLENPGTIPLELIEVQSGSYLGEDDIVRFEDSYGRAGKGKE
jgi:mannose-1-phosphate guanylyltransferase / mannose-6-phosphate isomerase